MSKIILINASGTRGCPAKAATSGSCVLQVSLIIETPTFMSTSHQHRTKRLWAFMKCILAAGISRPPVGPSPGSWFHTCHPCPANTTWSYTWGVQPAGGCGRLGGCGCTNIVLISRLYVRSNALQIQTLFLNDEVLQQCSTIPIRLTNTVLLTKHITHDKFSRICRLNKFFCVFIENFH
jgi:hypothetical protein